MIDSAIFKVKAGDGGNGLVGFRQEKYVPKGGPDGGNGGDGGSVFLKTSSHLNTLSFFAGKNSFKAEDGDHGGRAKRTGKNGGDLTILVPLGTLVYEVKGKRKKLLVDLKDPDSEICLIQGGKGGRGNWFFRSSTNTTPREAEEGEKIEEKTINLELKVLAQVGLVGLPNAGKSTLLSVLTRARPKIASYPFTTLSPNLGVMKNGHGKELVIADIPGLIEGASEGRGLGFKFLKHIERCRLLVFVLFPEEEMLEFSKEKLASSIWKQMLKIKKELKSFNETLSSLPAIVILNKKDLLPKERIEAIESFFSSHDQPILSISAATQEKIPDLSLAILFSF